MCTIWILALALGVVSADVGLGYHYQVPKTSYGVPSYQTGSSGFNGFSGSSVGDSSSASAGASFGISQAPTYSGASSSVDFGSKNSAYATAGTGGGLNYNTQQSSGSTYNYNSQGAGTGYNTNGFGTTSNLGGYQGSFGQNAQSSSGYYPSGGATIISSQPSQSSGSGYYNQYQTSGVNKYQEYYNQVVQQPAQVYKHFYVHAAPEEPEIPKPRQPLVLPPPQKHYKIIFIKAPVQQAPAPQLIPVPQQNEEKTIVYLLVKKPEDAQNIVLPKFEPKPPTKPEVYFIKYNDKHNPQTVINDIVSGYDNSDGTTSFSGVGTGYSAGTEGSSSGVSSGVIGDLGSSSGFTSGYSGAGLSSSSSGLQFGSTSQETGFGSASKGTGFSSASKPTLDYAFEGAGFGSSSKGTGISSASKPTLDYAFDGTGFGSASSGAGGSEGAYAFSTSLENAQGGAASQGQGQSFGSIGTQYTAGPTVSTATGIEASSLSSNLERIFGTPGTIASSTASSVDFGASSISTSQGVPHESYGVPKFKEY